MSREIKYRVWDEEKKKYCTEYNAMTLKHDGEFCIERGWCTISGDFEVEQYTGLKDKNGKEIYEGDIVEFGLSGRAERGYVAYADEYASFEVYSKRDFIFGCLFGHAGKVIGNIHENPELLGGEK